MSEWLPFFLFLLAEEERKRKEADPDYEPFFSLGFFAETKWSWKEIFLMLLIAFLPSIILVAATFLILR